MEANELSAWEQPVEVNLATLDGMVKELVELRKVYQDRKDIASRAYEEVEAMEAKISSVLQASGKSKYFVDGVGTAYLINKYVIRSPKDNQSKQLLFDYIKQHHGEDVLMSKLSINHQSLNSFYNEEVAALAKEGKTAQIPGIEEPVHEVNLGFRKG
jgi:hypothetical protein